MRSIKRQQAIYFRDILRHARATAQKDVEAFDAIVVSLERIGMYLLERAAMLGGSRTCLTQLAEGSPLAVQIPEAFPEYHLSFASLYELVRVGRNAAVHEGALARHVTVHAVEIALILEDALMNGADTVGDYMVRGPVCAAPWHPLSFIRQTLLINSFSYLPVLFGDGDTEQEHDRGWKLLSDLAIARYLRRATSEEDRRRRLARSLKDAIADDPDTVRLEPARICDPRDKIGDVLQDAAHLPVLVSGSAPDEVVGIITPFDLL